MENVRRRKISIDKFYFVMRRTMGVSSHIFLFIALQAMFFICFYIIQPLHRNSIMSSQFATTSDMNNGNRRALLNKEHVNNSRMGDIHSKGLSLFSFEEFYSILLNSDPCNTICRDRVSTVYYYVFMETD